MGSNCLSDVCRLSGHAKVELDWRTGKWSVVRPAEETSLSAIVIEGGDADATCDLKVGDLQSTDLLYCSASALVANRLAQNCLAGG